MTNEEIFEIADKYGWMDDFNRWNFQGDVALLEFVDAILKVERETCAVLIENTPTMLGSPKRDNLSWVGQPDLARVGEVGIWGHKREWVGLTDEDIYQVIEENIPPQLNTLFDMAKWVSGVVEAKLKEKNSGNP
jgi:hypothetical protein